MGGNAVIEEVIDDATIRMEKAMEALQRELLAVRTGRAAPSLVERIMVEQYGTDMPLNQLANIAAPEARMLTITPWDKSAIGAIEKAIRKSELGLNPTNDGSLIRIAIPPLTEDRRKQMVKVVHTKVEEAKIAVRNIRRDAISQAREFKDEKMVSEDDERRASNQIQELTNKYTTQADEIGKVKERDVMQV
ncbi:MAG: Ribosome recycling factor [uncultured Thermomicrobiales bacterium]|uniref:Ribosome-recycling factor n=1 Tax=uncultured Thermomicrobiales bacterium TaxID=1645740 RepID=A0A6J4VPT7_9BACT|nr:MAG: Ribosome recycling factor [uncultured Thermomicrobiales bacterium]